MLSLLLLLVHAPKFLVCEPQAVSIPATPTSALQSNSTVKTLESQYLISTTRTPVTGLSDRQLGLKLGRLSQTTERKGKSHFVTTTLSADRFLAPQMLILKTRFCQTLRFNSLVSFPKVLLIYRIPFSKLIVLIKLDSPHHQIVNHLTAGETQKSYI